MRFVKEANEPAGTARPVATSPGTRSQFVWLSCSVGRQFCERTVGACRMGSTGFGSAAGAEAAGATKKPPPPPPPEPPPPQATSAARAVAVKTCLIIHLSSLVLTGVVRRWRECKPCGCRCQPCGCRFSKDFSSPKGNHLGADETKPARGRLVGGGWDLGLLWR